MKFIPKVLLLFFILSFCSCKKEFLGSVDPNYIGEWHSENTFTLANGKITEIYFIINDSESEYGYLCDTACTACECQLLTSGKATINKKKTKMYIGSGNGKKKVSLKINEAPHLNSNEKWECKLEDQVMIKK